MNRIHSIAIGALLLGGLQLSAQTDFTALEEARDEAQARLDVARAALSEFYAQQEDEKVPMVQELEMLDSSLRELRRQALEAARLQENRQFGLAELEEQKSELDSNKNFLVNNLRTYASRLESNLLAAERSRYAAPVREALAAAEANTGSSDEERLTTQMSVLPAALQRIRDSIGGYTYTGTVVVENEDIVEGTYAIWGPAAFFASDSISGPVPNSGSGDDLASEAVVEPIPRATALNALIGDTVMSGEGLLPIDATGQASQVIGIQSFFWEDFQYQKGGWVIFVIGALLILALILIVAKLIQLMGIREPKQKDVDGIIGDIAGGRMEEAAAKAKACAGPAGELLEVGVANVNQDRELLEEVLYEKVIVTQPKVESLLPLIAVIAATAPLLGLLGTVTGMIKTFELITIFGAGDAGSLASGISEALLTTKWGLITAIICLIFHAILNRRAKGVISGMEQTAVSFLNTVGEMRGRKASSESTSSAS